MEQTAGEPMAAAWFLAAAAGPGNNPPEPDDDVIMPNVIISVSLDELDGLSGDMLV